MSEANAKFLEILHQQVRNLARTAGLVVPDGAPDDAIDACEDVLDQSIPPSYRRLLGLQNGWPAAWHDFDFAGTSDLIDPEGLFEEMRRFWWELREVDPDDAEACRGWDEPGGEPMPWQMIVFGVRDDGDVLVFDTRKSKSSGEAPVLRMSLDDGIVSRWPNLEEFMLTITSEGLEQV